MAIVNLTRYPIILLDPDTGALVNTIEPAEAPAEVVSKWNRTERIPGVPLPVLSDEAWVADIGEIPDPKPGTWYLVDRYDGADTTREDVLVPTRLRHTPQGMVVEGLARPW